MWLVGRRPGCCTDMAGACTASRGVPMAADSPVPVGIMPSGCGTQSRAPISKSYRTATLLTPSSVAWSPDGHLLACGTFLQGVLVWDVTARSPRWVGRAHATWVRRVVWSPDGTRLVDGD